MKTVEVNASRSYLVHIGAGLLSTVGQIILAVCRPEAAAIITDTNVGPLHADRVQDTIRQAGIANVPVFTFPAGEASKCGGTYLELLNFLAENHLTRTDCIVALGGGVVGDLAGFAAATYLRGIPFIQVPTTLLAAVDSSVGGKTAIDLPAGKNLAGAFYQPAAVVCDLDTLNTLPPDIFRDGCAEVLKYGILYDPELFAQLKEQGLDFSREKVIARCVELKRDVVNADEFDRGARQMLNLGHTFGHCVEAQSSFRVSHGQAVAIGTAMAARAACRLGVCDVLTRDAIIAVLEKFGLPSATEFSPDALCGSALADKKRNGSTINLILPHSIGNCVICPAAVSELKSIMEAGM